jgi:hypothetical protein
MNTYTTFIRSARNFQEFATAEKIEQETGLTLDEAQTACAEFNLNRNGLEIQAGTKMEFTVDE